MRRAAYSFVALVLTACASAPPPPPPSPPPTKAARRPARHGMGVSSELGDLDPAKVDETFRSLVPKLGACLAEANARNELVSGHVLPFVRIGEDGRVRWAYLAESSLGDRKAESCMLRAITDARWPLPEGGEGQAKKAFDFDLSDDVRPPVEWPASKVMGALATARDRLAACPGAPGARLRATLYVGTDGKVLGAGVAAADEKAEAKSDCVVAVLSGLALESPGSWPAKVGFDLP